MAIKLRRDLEEIVREDVEPGLCKSVGEYLKRAVTMLHEQETWLAAHRELVSSIDARRWTGTTGVDPD